jgi:hypothetical protein
MPEGLAAAGAEADAAAGAEAGAAAGAEAGAVSHFPGLARVGRLHSSEHCAPAVKSSPALMLLPVVWPLQRQQ